ncbi:esterase [Streptomyces sp. NPDC002690]
MPTEVRGAVVQRVSVRTDGPLDIAWLPATAPRLPMGRIVLRWEPASLGGWDVTAHLALATSEVHLASWPSASNHWPQIVRPTLHEVLGLTAALSVATAALTVSNRLAEV